MRVFSHSRWVAFTGFEPVLHFTEASFFLILFSFSLKKNKKIYYYHQKRPQYNENCGLF